MATQELEGEYNEFVAAPESPAKTFGELSKEQYKALMTQVVAADQTPLVPPKLYTPGTLIQGAPLNQTQAAPAPAPGFFLPQASPFAPPPFGVRSYGGPSFGDSPFGAPFAPPSFASPSFNPALYGLHVPGSVVSGSAAPAAAAQPAH